MAQTRTRNRQPSVLLTGFAPFDGAALNASWLAVSTLRGRRIAGHRVLVRELPVDFRDALPQLRRVIRETRPSLVVCVGQADTRACVSLERVAINLIDARIPDNAGNRPIDAPVVIDGPAAYFSTLPLKAMLAALREAGIPAEVSQTAGTYVCNQVFYGLMHALRRRTRVRAGFIHVPSSRQQAAKRSDAPGMPIETIAGALRIALRTALATQTDIPLAAGQEH